MTTLQHLTEDHSQDEQTSSVPGSLASLTALQENVSRLVTSVIFGAKSCEYWGKQNPDGSWAKTSQDSLPLNLETSSEGSSMTWPKWGLVSDGVVMELATLGQSTGATGSSSLLGTPTTNDAKNSLTESQRGRGTLTAGLLPTPRSNSEMAATINPAEHLYPNLETVIARAMLPTPSTFDSMTFKKKDLTDKTTKNGHKGGRSNLREVEFHKMLPTPRTSQDHKPVRQLAPSEADGSHGTTLVGAIGDELDVETGAGVVLNPRFVEWMMMFPTGWLD